MIEFSILGAAYDLEGSMLHCVAWQPRFLNKPETRLASQGVLCGESLQKLCGVVCLVLWHQSVRWLVSCVCRLHVRILPNHVKRGSCAGCNTIAKQSAGVIFPVRKHTIRSSNCSRSCSFGARVSRTLVFVAESSGINLLSCSSVSLECV